MRKTRPEALASIAVLIAIAATPAAADTFFRLDIGSDFNVEPGAQNDETRLSYPDQSANLGDVVTATPIVAAGIPIYGFSWHTQPTPNAVIDETTGTITWTVDGKGPQRAYVNMYTSADMTEWVTAPFNLEVQSDYTIATTPPAFQFQAGNDTVTQSFITTVDPAQPGGTWSIKRSAFAPTLMESDSAALLDASSIYQAGGDIRPGEHWIQFVHTAPDGTATYGNLVEITVAPPPSFDYEPTITSTYRLDRTPSGLLLQVLPGIAFTVPATAANGASYVPAAPPSWLAGQTGNQSPPGVMLEPDGDIAGSASGAPALYTPFLIPAATADGETFGATRLSIEIVEAFYVPTAGE